VRPAPVLPEPPRVTVTTWLELTDPAELRPARDPGGGNGPEFRIRRVEPPDGALSRWFYVEVGRPHAWTDHLGRDAAAWEAWAAQVETWVLTVGGERAGFHELRPEGDAVELAYLGLLPAYQGLGLGGRLLTHALRRALEIAPRVWVHTETRDGRAALPNYLARGMRPYRREAVWQDLREGR
jgi:GNAT superfamily N-acetyltransferase